jgi:uncharacterized membrane protein
MNTNYIYILALGIGIAAGLRSMTAPAVVSWTAHFRLLHLERSPLAFMGSLITVILFSICAVGEYIADKLPKTPNRTAPPGLIARIVTGGLSGGCIYAANEKPMLVGMILGGIGGVIGAFSGYETRKWLVKAVKVKDIFIAIPEDLIAIFLAYYVVLTSGFMALHLGVIPV